MDNLLMPLLPDAVNRYRSTRAATSPWRLNGDDDAGFIGAVVIPALAEKESLFATLSSLAQNPAEFLARHLVVVVVNHREDASPDEKANNLHTLELLPEWRRKLPLKLSWVDAATTGLELPVKAGGVGLARKIGLDLALPRLDHCQNPYLVCLDADTTVRHDYLPALEAHFAKALAGGGVIPFVHREAPTSCEQRAIERYELFLRCYVLGLSLAGSPYAFHTVGSAMACRASAYVGMGGMNTRQAAEDFYFLQQLSRTAGIAPVKGTCVYPSPRSSHRVPFGTGKSISRLLAGDPEAVLFYRAECYQVLGEWLRLFSSSLEATADQLLDHAGIISPCLREFLEDAEFLQIWPRLCRHNPDPLRRREACNGWFDGLKTMKLIHHLSAGPYPRCSPDQAVPPLFKAAGFRCEQDQASQLAFLQRLQNDFIAT